jgi:hypothetical protein
VRDLRLRRKVLRFRGCLGALPAAERRVLALRAGVGVAHPRSRRRVAHMTGMSRKRIGRLERTGLRRLDTLQRRSGCGGATAATAGGPEGSSGLGATSIASIAETTALGGSPAADRTPRSAVIAEHKTNHGEATGRSGVGRLLPPAFRGINRPGQTGLVLALIALAGSGYAFWRHRRMRRPVD